MCSANYVLNEWLDARFDRFHPLKRDRPSVVGELRGGWVYAEYGALSVLGLALCAQVSAHAFWTAAALWGMRRNQALPRYDRYVQFLII